MYVSMNKQLVFTLVSASCFVFALQRLKRLVISKVSSGKVTLWCEQLVASEIGLNGPGLGLTTDPSHQFSAKILYIFPIFLLCYMPYSSYPFYLFIFVTFVKSTVTNLVTVLCFPACCHTDVIVSELCTFTPKLNWPNSCRYGTTVRRTKFNGNPLRWNRTK
jgi:hypothetical protein